MVVSERVHYWLFGTWASVQPYIQSTVAPSHLSFADRFLLLAAPFDAYEIKVHALVLGAAPT